MNAKTPPEDQRPLANRPTPANKLTPQEEKEIIRVCNQPEFQSLPPSQIVPRLADRGVYIASESTMYRVLKKYKQNNHRGRSKKPIKRPVSTHQSTGPNQVWMWDITWLPGPVKGSYFYLYLMMDLFSRKVVAWEVWDSESAENASVLVRRAVMSENRFNKKAPLILHSDNGSPMKGATLLETLYSLGITPSRSRPRVSNDNPYAESIFRTFKYRPSFPTKGFSDLESSRTWALTFIKWYNKEHRHSGLNYLTPEQRHTGQTDAIFAKRTQVYEAARAKNPLRWSRSTRSWKLDDVVWLNPEKVNSEYSDINKTSQGTS